MRQSETSASSSEGSWISPAVEQQVLAGNVPRLRAAEIGAGVAELLNGAEPFRRIRLPAGLGQVGRALAQPLGVELEVGAQPVGVERAGQEAVDRHVVLHGGAR